MQKTKADNSFYSRALCLTIHIILQFDYLLKAAADIRGNPEECPEASSRKQI
jgi:hypothetical protein